MKVSELRIGNLVSENNAVVCVINGFSPFGHSVRCDESEGCNILYDIIRLDDTINRGWESDSDKIKPIPLTGEWLLKFGFEFISEAYCYHDKYHAISEANKDLDYWVFIAFCTNDEDCHIKIKYVHQLQNLFFCLCGEELTIKK